MRGPLLPLLVALVLVPGCFTRVAPEEPALRWEPAPDDVTPARASTEAAGPTPATPTQATPPAPPENASASPPPAAQPDPEPAPQPAADDASAPAAAPEANATQAGNATGAAHATQATNATQAANATQGNQTAANATGNATKNATGVVLHQTTFDFSGSGGLVPRTATDSFEVPRGYERLVVNLTFVRKGASGLMDRDATVSLLPPGGFLPAGTAQARPNTNATLEADADPGRWTLQYDGSGPVEARIVVTAFTSAGSARP